MQHKAESLARGTRKPAPPSGPSYPKARPTPRRPRGPPPHPPLQRLPKTAPALEGGRHRAVSPFSGQVTREPAAGPLRGAPPSYRPWDRAWVRSPARHALVRAPRFRKTNSHRGLGKTSSRSRQPAQAADRGVERAPPASQPPGGPASTTAIPAAAAAGELPAARRAGLPESLPAPGLEGLPGSLFARVSGNVPGSLSAPTSRQVTRESLCPSAGPATREPARASQSRREAARRPKAPRPRPRQATRKPPRSSLARAARRQAPAPNQVRAALPESRPGPDEQPTTPTVPPISHPRAAVI